VQTDTPPRGGIPPSGHFLGYLPHPKWCFGALTRARKNVLFSFGKGRVQDGSAPFPDQIRMGMMM
jgi:hypothetical protein